MVAHGGCPGNACEGAAGCPASPPYRSPPSPRWSPPVPSDLGRAGPWQEVWGLVVFLAAGTEQGSFWGDDRALGLGLNPHSPLTIPSSCTHGLSFSPVQWDDNLSAEVVGTICHCSMVPPLHRSRHCP